MPASPAKQLLFVCMGNICRSPAAEGVVAHRVRERGLEAEIQVDSAGTIGYHVGSPPDPRMTHAAKRRGYRLGGRARQFQPADFARFDLIVAMDQDNYRDILNQVEIDQQAERVRMLSDFLPEKTPRDVPDPYYGGAKGFETVLDMIEAASDPMIDSLLRPKA